ncbi:hypothetical protein AGRA3207_002043 [Actinomadura graeca]|uniref:Uncharacterized protein n=1 Tax=Actinomadura graeca TaxID=2750812 RepID=A0ABX8QR86_9ACTN|nr:hypothetical protein [Actinomadura graeca]QXJ21211.1 hypothetical protein AGRA3207_002043 [Actinomadura graeca]
MVTIEMEWALWSERPGARDDYTVLSCSEGQLRPAHFKKIITRFSPGTAEAQWGLPRVTVVAVDVAQRPHIGMAIQARSDQHDGTGRRIAPTRFFLFPYEALDGNPVSYHALYSSLIGLPLPEAGDSRLLRVEVPGFDASVVAEDLELLGADSTFAAAHLLHMERLCVTGAEQATTDERLRYLDAAVSLLPYGYRAKITATTWANSATRHNLRMVFSRRANDPGTVEVPWEGPTAAPPASAFASRLKEMLGRFPHPQVIGLLAGHTAPRAFDDPHGASDTLHTIEDRLQRDHALSSGDPAPSDLRRWLDEEDLSDGDAARILRKLLPVAQSKDVERIARWLPVVSAKNLASWRRPLSMASKRLLWKEGARLAPLLRALNDDKETDTLLADLIGTRPTETAQVTNGLGAIAHLLVELVLPNTQVYPLTGEAVRGDGPVVLALVFALYADNGGPPALEWAWERLPDGLVTAADRLLGTLSEEPLDVAVIKDIAQHGDSCVATMLQIACLWNRLGLLADGFVEWLVSTGGCEPASSGYWGNVLSSLTPDDPSMLAMIDVVLLATSHRPCWMMVVVREQWMDYEDSFVSHWRRPWPNPELMIIELGDHLRSQSWHDVPGRATDIVSSLITVLELHDQPLVRNALIESLSNAHDLSNDPFAEEWLKARGGRPKSPAPTPHPEPPVDPEPLPLPARPGAISERAASIVEYIGACERRGATSSQVYAHIRDQKMLTDARVAVEVVTSLAVSIGQRDSLNTGINWRNHLIDFLCEEQFGSALAQEFKKRYLTILLRGMSDQIRLLQNFRDASAEFLDEKENAAKIKSAADVLLNVINEKAKGAKRRRRGRDRLDEQPSAPRSAPPKDAFADQGRVE